MTVSSPASSLSDLRRAAWDAFRSAPVPPRSSETWRRVDFSRWGLDALTSFPVPADGAAPAAPALGGASGLLEQDLRSSRPAVALDPELAAKGVVLSSIEEALRAHPRLVEPALIRCAGPDFGKLEAANLAGFAGGAFLHVPAGVKVAKPFDLSFRHPPELAYGFPRSIVALGEGAEATVIEDHSGADGKRVSVSFGKVTLGRGAKLRHFYNQGLGGGVVHFWSQRVELAQDALFRQGSILLGGALHKSDLHVELLAPGARSELFGLVFGSGAQLFDAHTSQMHRAHHTQSDLLYKVALQERARSLYTGLIRVENDAIECDAYQQNNNLLLSDAARADTTPVLEILTDQVRCKHGATMGPVSAEELFYLGCRGLEPREAAKMLVMGFFEPILGQVPLERLKDRLPAEVERRIGVGGAE